MKSSALILFVLLVLLVSLFSWLAVRYDPRQFQLSMERELSRRWDAKVHFETIAIRGTFPPSLEIRNLVIESAKSGELLARARRVVLKPHWGPWLLTRLAVSLARVHDPEIFLRRAENGRWNWDLDSLRPSGPLAEQGKLTIREWQIVNATLNYTDETVKNRFHFSVPGITSEPHPGDFRIPVHFQIVPRPPLELDGIATWDLRRRTLIVQADASERTLRLNGEIYPHKNSFQEKMKIQFLNHPASPQAVLSGSLTGFLDGTAQGTNADAFLASFEGRLHAELRQGSFKALNIPQGILVKVSKIPSFDSLAAPPYPPGIREILTRPDTPFDLLECDSEFRGREMTTQNFRLRHSLFSLLGKGRIRFGGEEALEWNLAFRPSPLFTTFILSRVPELDALADSSNSIAVPFTLQGSISQLLLDLPLDQIARRLVEVRGDELAARGYQKLNEFLEIQQ